MTHFRTYPIPSGDEKTAKWIPYGYLYNPETPALIAIDPEAADTVRYIFEQYINGVSLSIICKTLTEKGVPNPATRRVQLGAPSVEQTTKGWRATALNQMLFHPVYAGDWILEGRVWDCCYYYSGADCPAGIELPVIEKDHHEALVPRDFLVRASKLFLEQRQERNTTPPNRISETTDTTLDSLIGLLHCGICGRFLTSAEISLSKGTCFSAYLCSSITQKKHGDCANHLYQLDTLPALVQELLVSERKNAMRFTQMSSKRSQDKTYTELEAEFQVLIDNTVDEVRSLMEEQNKLERNYKNHAISPTEYEELRNDLSTRIANGEHQVMVALNKIRDFRKLCGEKNAWVSLFSGMPEGTSEAPIEYKKYIQRINLFPNQPPVIHLKKMDAKKQLMEALNLPYEDAITEDTNTTETTEVE